MIKTQIPLLFILLIISCNTNADKRWYTQTQVDKGQVIFEKNCATCHGDNAQGTLEWKKTLADGSYPPPPLNGTAHTWHHPINILRRTIYYGGIPLGGTMPSFKDTLTKEEMDAVIAYFQSKWDKKIYDAWSERNEAQNN